MIWWDCGTILTHYEGENFLSRGIKISPIRGVWNIPLLAECSQESQNEGSEERIEKGQSIEEIGKGGLSREIRPSRIFRGGKKFQNENLILSQVWKGWWWGKNRFWWKGSGEEKREVEKWVLSRENRVLPLRRGTDFAGEPNFGPKCNLPSSSVWLSDSLLWLWERGSLLLPLLSSSLIHPPLNVLSLLPLHLVQPSPLLSSVLYSLCYVVLCCVGWCEKWRAGFAMFFCSVSERWRGWECFSPSVRNKEGRGRTFFSPSVQRGWCRASL